MRDLTPTERELTHAMGAWSPRVVAALIASEHDDDDDVTDAVASYLNGDWETLGVWDPHVTDLERPDSLATARASLRRCARSASG